MEGWVDLFLFKKVISLYFYDFFIIKCQKIKKNPQKTPKSQTNKQKPLIQIIIIDNFLKTSIKISANMQFIAQKNGIVLEISLSSNTTCQIFGE